MFDRILDLINENDFEKIENNNILIVGLGGVGGYALEALIRSGIKNLTIVDGDKIEISNLNRQLISLQDNIGQYKTAEAKKRALSINPNAQIKIINKFINNDNIKELNLQKFNYVIDACDDINLKLLLIKDADQYKLISAMGTAKKINPNNLLITTLNKTNNDPLARILRKKVKELNLKTKFKVVSSTENIINKKLGTLIFVPAVAGFLCAYYVIDDILKT